MPPERDNRQIDGSPILSTRNGTGTGDTVYKTSDGRTWVSCQPYTIASSTGQMVAAIKPAPPARGR